MQGILPSLGGAILFFAMGWSFWLDWKTTGADANSYTSWLMPFPPHWRIGGVFLIGALALLLGVVLMVIWRVVSPPFFHRETLPPVGIVVDETGHFIDAADAEPPTRTALPTEHDWPRSP
jgi:hypothetical protein